MQGPQKGLKHCHGGTLFFVWIDGMKLNGFDGIDALIIFLWTPNFIVQIPHHQKRQRLTIMGLSSEKYSPSA